MTNRNPWYKVVTPWHEVREDRSFRPDEFAIALEQMVAGTVPLDDATHSSSCHVPVSPAP